MMGTMASLNAKSNSIFDPVRKKWVDATPEEEVRQALIEKMVRELGYPLSLLAVEKEISQLPHLSLVETRKIPRRRIDLIAFGVNIHPQWPLFPLLMVECKAVPLTRRSTQQVIGYNALVQSPFLALANASGTLMGQYDHKTGLYTFQEGLFSYEKLVSLFRFGE